MKPFFLESEANLDVSDIIFFPYIAVTYKNIMKFVRSLN